MLKQTSYIAAVLLGLMAASNVANAQEKMQPVPPPNPGMEMKKNHRKPHFDEMDKQKGEMRDDFLQKKIEKAKAQYDKKIAKINDSNMPDEVKAKLKQHALEMKDLKIKNMMEVDKLIKSQQKEIKLLRDKHQKEAEILKDKYKKEMPPKANEDQDDDEELDDDNAPEKGGRWKKWFNKDK